MVGSIGASGRPGQRIALPLAAALCLHGVLALVLISWKPPPVGKPAAATEIFFVSLGREALPKSAQPAPAEEPPQRQAALTPAQEPSKTAPASPLLAKLALAPEETTALVSLIASGASLSPDPAAAPMAVSPPPSPPAQEAAPSGASQRCKILEAVQASLNGSPDVHQALAMIPRQARSVANAILLWNGQWLMLGSSQSGALQPVEQIVKETVERAPQACQAEVLQGPRLILVSEPHDTFVLAFGSGDWRWTDLLETATLQR